jgi:hypothetical protein
MGLRLRPREKSKYRALKVGIILWAEQSAGTILTHDEPIEFFRIFGRETKNDHRRLLRL